PGDLFKREATVDRVAELSRHRVHVELADGPPFRSAARRDLRLDAPERQVIEILPDDALVRDHEHPSAEPVPRALRRLHEREAEGEPGESLRRSAAWIEADRRVPVHVSAIDAFDAEESVLRELAEEDHKEPTIDHNLRADLLGTVEARPVVEEAEDAPADAFLDLDRIDCLRGPGRRRGRPSPAGGPLARRRMRLRNDPGRENLPELLLRDDFVAGRQAADREALRRPEVVWRQEDELSRTERGNRREDVLAQGRDDELAFARIPQASRVHDVHGDAAARSLEHGFDIERRAGGEEEALRANGHRFRATDQRGPLPAREELRRVRRGIA